MRIRFLVGKGGFCILSLTIGVAIAAAQPNPADPGAATPATKYESPFAGYQPFRDENIRSWQEANKEVADNSGMGTMGGMKHTPGMAMPGMDAKAGEAPKAKQGAVGHDMGAMKDMPGMDKPKGKGAAGHDTGTMKGMDKPSAAAPRGQQGAAGHDMGAMKDMPGMEKRGDSASRKQGHDSMTMAKPNSAPRQAANTETAPITGTGIVQAIDRANGKVRLTHDPIAALGWPKMTMFFRLKDASLADQVKEGTRVEFLLEKSASGYVISRFQKGTEESSNHKSHSKE